MHSSGPKVCDLPQTAQSDSEKKYIMMGNSCSLPENIFHGATKSDKIKDDAEGPSRNEQGIDIVEFVSSVMNTQDGSFDEEMDLKSVLWIEKREV